MARAAMSPRFAPQHPQNRRAREPAGLKIAECNSANIASAELKSNAPGALQESAFQNRVITRKNLLFNPQRFGLYIQKPECPHRNM